MGDHGQVILVLGIVLVIRVGEVVLMIVLVAGAQGSEHLRDVFGDRSRRRQVVSCLSSSNGIIRLKRMHSVKGMKR